MSEYTYTLEQMTEVTEFTHKGKPFKVVCSHQNFPYHPSHWSFCDEVETREAWWDIEPGDVVLDVGADFGSYTLSALACGAAKVLAWSPPFKLPQEPHEAQTLRLSLKANGWSDRAYVLEHGLWSSEGWMAGFDGPRPAQVFEHRSQAAAAIEGQEGHVSMFSVGRLDEYHVGGPFPDHLIEERRCSRADWLKIDTEGCELPILQGGIETIKRCKPRILLEHHYHIDPECEAKCDAFLAELGYTKVGTRPHHSIAHSLYTHPEGR